MNVLETTIYLQAKLLQGKLITKFDLEHLRIKIEGEIHERSIDTRK